MLTSSSKSILVVLVVMVVITVVKGQNIKCGKKGQKRLDDVTQEMATFGSPTRRYPTSEAQMKEYCKTDRANEKWMSAYANQCLDKLSQQVIGLLSYSISATNKRHCGGRRKRAFLRWSTCGNAAKPETVQCWRTLNAFLPRITRSPNKWKIPMVCWYVT